MSSSSTLSPAPADFWDKYHAERSPDVPLAPGAPREREREREPRPAGRPRRRRPIRAFFRFLITVAIGVGGTLAWQAYGDMARQMAAATYPDQLGWLAPPSADSTATAAPADAAPATIGSAAAPASALDQQQLNAVSLGLAGVRRSIEELAAQVASGQQQVAGDIARLQASEQDILNRISAPPTRPAPAPAHKPAPTPLAPAAPAAH
ncbi:MAG TPA: hypothetical protein VLX44_18890 [Xanthobacteraceae bacterium]|nr:hypothetical protein [Xanthobacteraceae bacterium]